MFCEYSKDSVPLKFPPSIELNTNLDEGFPIIVALIRVENCEWSAAVVIEDYLETKVALSKLEEVFHCVFDIATLPMIPPAARPHFHRSAAHQL